MKGEKKKLIMLEVSDQDYADIEKEASKLGVTIPDLVKLAIGMFLLLHKMDAERKKIKEENDVEAGDIL